MEIPAIFTYLYDAQNDKDKLEDKPAAEDDLVHLLRWSISMTNDQTHIVFPTESKC